MASIPSSIEKVWLKIYESYLNFTTNLYPFLIGLGSLSQCFPASDFPLLRDTQGMSRHHYRLLQVLNLNNMQAQKDPQHLPAESKTIAPLPSSADTLAEAGGSPPNERWCPDDRRSTGRLGSQWPAYSSSGESRAFPKFKGLRWHREPPRSCKASHPNLPLPTTSLPKGDTR